MASERFEMRMPADLLRRIDEARGYEPRASFIKRTLEQALPPRTKAPESGELTRATRSASPALTPARKPTAPLMRRVATLRREGETP